ncbi:hypothetical protein [Viridibacillus arvi]|uniref:hypothetical protein n=1 Tax=Viridibacillus arvi TaxID=263475 RepID=UPI0034CD35EB
MFKIHTSNNYFGLKFWEGVLVDGESRHDLCVKLSCMKELGVAKSMNSSRKVEEWLNSVEGRKWIDERLKVLTHTGIGSFL